jgi:hypothetical protein
VNILQGSQALLSALTHEGLPPLPEDLARVTPCYLPALYLRCHYDRDFAIFAESSPEVFVALLQKCVAAVESLLSPQWIEHSKRVFQSPAVSMQISRSEKGPLEVEVLGASHDVEPLGDAEIVKSVRDFGVRVWGAINWFFIRASIQEIESFSYFKENVLITFFPMIPSSPDVSDSADSADSADSEDFDVVLTDNEDPPTSSNRELPANSSGDGLPVDRSIDEVPTLKLPDFLKVRKGGQKS